MVLSFLYRFFAISIESTNPIDVISTETRNNDVISTEGNEHFTDVISTETQWSGEIKKSGLDLSALVEVTILWFCAKNNQSIKQSAIPNS